MTENACTHLHFCVKKHCPSTMNFTGSQYQDAGMTKPRWRLHIKDGNSGAVPGHQVLLVLFCCSLGE